MVIFCFTRSDMFEIGKPYPEDIGVGASHCFLVLGCSLLFWSCRFMFCCIHDHIPQHANDFCREVAFIDFFLPPSLGDMNITLDGVSCILHLPIWEKLLGYERIGREEVVEMMSIHLGVGLTEASKEAFATRGARARFICLEKLYKEQM